MGLTEMRHVFCGAGKTRYNQKRSSVAERYHSFTQEVSV
jgi:hypothetical protein